MKPYNFTEAHAPISFSMDCRSGLSDSGGWRIVVGQGTNLEQDEGQTTTAKRCGKEGSL